MGVQPCTSRATDYVRANVDGGITGVMKSAALAESHGLDVELHGHLQPRTHSQFAAQLGGHFLHRTAGLSAVEIQNIMDEVAQL